MRARLLFTERYCKIYTSVQMPWRFTAFVYQPDKKKTSVSQTMVASLRKKSNEPHPLLIFFSLENMDMFTPDRSMGSIKMETRRRMSVGCSASLGGPRAHSNDSNIMNAPVNERTDRRL